MESTTMDWKKSGGIHGLASLPLLLALFGCASGTPVPKAVQPSEVHGVMQRPARVIISFQGPAADNTQLSAAISEACHCQPIFLRSYLGNALIYEIALPPGQTFAAFEVELMRNAPRLGIKAVEQDIIMQHQ